jgi:hypothetical protein
MKKLTGWIIIIFCSFFLLIFVLSLVALTPGLLTKKSSLNMTISQTISSITGFVIVVSLLIYGLRNGINRIKKERPIEIIDYPEKIELKLTGQIEYIDYRNLFLGLNFNKPYYLIILGILLLSLLSFWTNTSLWYKLTNPHYLLFIYPIVIMLVPVFILFQIKKYYKSNKTIQEKLDYNISNDSIQIKGQTVDSLLKWEHFSKIKETKNFFVLYQGKMISTLIDKKMFKDSDLEDFKVFIKSINFKRE